MKKDPEIVHNICFLLSELQDYVDELDFTLYDDFEEMKEAQKEVLKILKSIKDRRLKWLNENS